MDTNYNRKNRRKYSLKAHIVLVTKYRKQLPKGIISEDIKNQILDISHKYNYEIIAMETDKDHIHFLISYDTTDSICQIVKRMKLLQPLNNSYKPVIFLLVFFCYISYNYINANKKSSWHNERSDNIAQI